MADEVIQITVTEDAPLILGTVSTAVTAPVAYHHMQGTPASEWVIQHNLGFFPNVTTLDSSGSIAEGEIVYESQYSLRVTFSAPFSGDAYLS